jgi:stage II sporulation protein M
VEEGMKRRNSIIKTHIENNLREYAIASTIFIIGILFGVIFINNLNDTQNNEIGNYISTSVENLKESQDINQLLFIKETIKENLTFVTLLWLMGSTVIGLLLVYIIVAFKGFCLSYTISAIFHVLNNGKTIAMLVSTMLLKNIIVIPCTIALAVSGMKVYKSIMQDRRRENIKLEILRHTCFSTFILIVLILSSLIEVYLSQLILKCCVKYI